MTDQRPDAGSSEAATDGPAPYRVLARKYRPASFEDLIGQDALVRTLTNAIQSDRLAQAYILTGVRGVGKTTTARIIARALNCIGPDGKGGATAQPCGVCANCTAIAADRHVDVIEMDAASRTGIDDIRELIEGVRYRPVQARRKVYIIDEVHMLSKQAFNGLLKTLEEPPEHVVFIFATTEIRKVPVTVLSRCQRFDLRRVDQEVLSAHFARIAKAEAVEAEDAALALIARAADGSVRDGLSLLDQAIALGEGKVAADQVRDMLGLADRIRVLDLFEAVMRGQAAEALAILGALHEAGADPAVVLQDLLELSHLVTKAKVVPETLGGIEVPEAERVRGKALADGLSMAALTRAWQILLKGMDEVRFAPASLRAAEMVLIRLAYASDLPSPAELVARLGNGGDSAPGPATAPTGGGAPAPRAQAGGGMRSSGGRAQAAALPDDRPEIPGSEPSPGREPTAQAALAPMPSDFSEVLALVRARRETILASHLAGDVHLVRFERGRIELRPNNRAPRNFAGSLSRLLQEATGERWVVTISQEPGEATLRDQEQASAERARKEILNLPLVRAVLETFPGARLKDSRERAPVAASEPPPPLMADESGLPLRIDDLDHDFDAFEDGDEPE
jgi:DNA polymerase-3 subunit gamma/tau